MTSWLQLSLRCQAAQLEQVETLLQELGAVSISLRDAGDEPIYGPLPGETPVWSESIVTATFDATIDAEKLRLEISTALPAELTAGLYEDLLHEEDWEQVYRQFFQPVECAPGLWIVPSWLQPPEPAARVIRLDPGLAFGTGSHPTTALCLAWLGQQDISGCDVIDYGCGSGILAIAAIKLGAARVYALDIDLQALGACRANLEKNKISEYQVRTVLPGALPPDQVDLLMANILAGPLIDLAPRFAELVKYGGRIILSGILDNQLQEILVAYQPYFEIDPARYRDQWVCVSATRLQAS